MAIITAAQVKEYLPGLQSTGEDTPIASLIAEVDAAIADYLGFPIADSATTPSIEDATYTFYMDGPGGRKLACPIRPIVSVTTLHDDPAWTYGASELIAATDYDALDRKKDGLVILDEDAVAGSFSTSEDAIKLVVVAGYATIPTAIQNAAARWVAGIWKHRGAQGEQNAGDVPLRPETMPLAVRELLDPYRCMRALLRGA